MLANFSRRALDTTVTEEKAMAVPAIIGLRRPAAANGIPIQLKIRAQKRFCLILVKVLRLKLIACTNELRSLRTKTISAASTAMSVPDPMAKPISAVARQEHH